MGVFPLCWAESEAGVARRITNMAPDSGSGCRGGRATLALLARGSMSDRAAFDVPAVTGLLWKQ